MNRSKQEIAERYARALQAAQDAGIIAPATDAHAHAHVMPLDGGNPLPETTNPGDGRKRRKKARKLRQKIKRIYALAREDAQLAGLIPTVPEGALQPEVAPGASALPRPDLIRKAVKHGWPTRDSTKPHIVDELVAAAMDRDADVTFRIECMQVLMLLDRLQHDLDHSEEV